MKRILLLVTGILLFSQVLCAQTWTSRVATISTNDSLLTVVAPDGYFLAGIKFDSSLTSGTNKIEVLVPGDATTSYDPLWYQGSAYTETITSGKTGVSFNIQAMAAWQVVRLRLNLKQTGIKLVTLRFLKI